MSEKINVFLLTEKRLLREALSRIFGENSDLNLVGALPVSPQIVEEISNSDADVLLASANILTDLHIIPEVLNATPGLRVVLVGMDLDENVFLCAIAAGVLGYVLRDASSLEVADAVRAVARDEAVCPPSLCRVLFDFVAQQQFKPTCLRAKHPYGLSYREQQLVEMMGRGMSNKEIATFLNLSEQTVRIMCTRFFAKRVPATVLKR